MALDMKVIDEKFGPIEYSYNQDQVILYALGIGAGVDELDFVYEKNLLVFPTFAVAPLIGGIFHFIKMAGVNLKGLLHGEQKVILHQPIPTSGTFNTTGCCRSIYDKGDKGALFTVDFETRDQNGELLFTNILVGWDRTAGNFGGEPGPKAEKIVVPDEEPFFQKEYKTSPDQAALYRLSGDKNPLHIDPEFAKLGGLDKPILHGLCTYGFAGRAILHGVCGGDPARFKSFSARFTGMVYPGETLITNGWRVGDNKYVIQTITGDGRLVLGNAEAETA